MRFEKKWDVWFGQMIEIYLPKDLRFDHEIWFEICPSLLCMKPDNKRKYTHHATRTTRSQSAITTCRCSFYSNSHFSICLCHFNREVLTITIEQWSAFPKAILSEWSAFRMADGYPCQFKKIIFVPLETAIKFWRKILLTWQLDDEKFWQKT